MLLSSLQQLLQLQLCSGHQATLPLVLQEWPLQQLHQLSLQAQRLQLLQQALLQLQLLVQGQGEEARLEEEEEAGEASYY